MTEPVSGSAATVEPGPDTHPHLCWSRHLDNVGKPRPVVQWVLTYGCKNGHVQTDVRLCDRCATSLVAGRQHCEVCVAPQVVTSIEEATDGNWPR